MSFISEVFETRQVVSPDPAEAAWNPFLGGQRSTAGTQVNHENSLTLPAFWCGVRILSETIGMTPIGIFERLEPQGKRPDPSHELWSLIRVAPNAEMDAATWKTTMMAHMVVYGNAYSVLEGRETNPEGRIAGIWPLLPDRMKVKRRPLNDPQGRANQLYYEYTSEKLPRPVEFEPWQLLHLHGLGFDGLQGYSLVNVHFQTIGGGLGQEEFIHRFTGEGTTPGLVVQHPNPLGEKTVKKLRSQLAEAYSRLGNTHRLMLLDEGMEAKNVTMPLKDAQMLESRRYTKVQILAEVMRIPPHMGGDLEEAHHSNIFAQNISFNRDTMGIWWTLWQQGLHRQCMNVSRTHFPEFNRDVVTQADIETRYKAYQIGIQYSILTPNEVRSKENMNPLPGGDRLLAAVNLMPLEDMGEDLEEDEQERARLTSAVKLLRQSLGEPTLRLRVRKAWLPFFRRAGKRVLRRELADLRRELALSFDNDEQLRFARFIVDYYQPESRFHKFVLRVYSSVVLSYGEVVREIAAEEVGVEVGQDAVSGSLSAYAATAVVSHLASSRNQLQRLMLDFVDEGGQDFSLLRSRIEERLDGWRGSRADKFAKRQVVKAGEATALETFRRAGVAHTTWRGGDCPLCRSLVGTSVQTNSNYVEKGESVDPQDGKTTPLVPRTAIGHPPLHRGCDCWLEPGG